jgi:CHAT domain-containing protein
MATDSPFGRAARYIAPLLILLLFTGSAAAPLPPEQAYREARAAVGRNDLLSGQRIAEKALAHTCADDDRDAIWALRILLGEVIAKRGDGAAALQMLKPELPPRLRTSETAVYRLLALGYAANTAAPDDLPKYLQQAHDLARAYQPQMLYTTHVAVAMVVATEEAVTHLLAAAEIAERQHDASKIALVKSALQLKYTEAAQLAQAVEMGEAALVTYRDTHAFGRIATTSGNLGWAYLELGDRERAMALFAEAIEASTLAGADRERVEWLNARGLAFSGELEFAAAESSYREALDFGRRTKNDQLGNVLSNLSRTALETGRYAEAQRLNSEAIAERQQRAGTDLRSNRVLQARIDTMTGNYAAAEKTLHAVLNEAKQRKETEWEAQARLAQLYVRMDRAGDADEAFEHAIDSFRSAREAVANPELRLSYFNIAKDLLDTYIDFLVRSDRGDDALAATEKSRAQTLLERTNGIVPRYTDPRTIARQRGLTILCYWLGREHSYVWNITPSAVTVAVLPPDETIAALADAYHDDLLQGSRGSIEASGERGRALYDMLVEPALHGTVPVTPITIVADGRLHALNFETLVTGQSAHYWIEDVVLSSASSLQLLARQETERAHGAGMLLVGDPLAVARHPYPELQFAAEEIASVKRHFRNTKALTRDDATPAAYRAADPGKYELIHFVAHGVASLQRPLDSAIILGEDAQDHYELFARDIVAQPLSARLVTISSCSGAGERTYAGEGLVGLAWAFLRAGASEVVAALWDVDDRATAALMDDFYAGIQSGRSPATALRDAKLKLVDGEGPYRRPKYWAPFVLYSGS